MINTLQDKSSVVIGGGSGIGKAIATEFLNSGASVIICGRNPDKLKVARDEIFKQTDKQVKICEVDLSQIDSVVKLFSFVSSIFSSIDIIVNSSGVHAANRSFKDITPDDWEFILKNNTTALFNLLYVTVPILRQRKSGHIINISSVAATRASVLAGTSYTASKHAVNGLMNTVALEETKNGIRFSTISPGPTNTPLVETRKIPPTQEERQKLLKPEEVAQAALFVASLPENAFVEELIIRPTQLM
jgi:NADP-dependent 3-hydroxy acid dehydrogenase YdfG